jgi:hypothetical protein
MIHYSCDRCKRILDPEDDMRYVVKLEAYAAMEPLEAEEAEDDRDHLLEIQEILERIDDADNDQIVEGVYQKQRYDLCSECYKKFIKNPVGRELAAHLGFSQN